MISKEIKSRLNQFGNFPFIFTLFALAIFFWINGPAFFEYWDSSHSNLIMVYFIMFLVFAMWSKTESRSHLKKPVKDAIPGYTAGVLITFTIMNALLIIGVLSTSAFPPELFWPTVIIQFTIIAPVEEIIFRGIILEYTGILISSILFAVWHSYAYSFIWYTGGWDTFNWGAMIIVFSIGMILAMIVEISKKSKSPFLGFPTAIAIHATYNCCILGALALGV